MIRRVLVGAAVCALALGAAPATSHQTQGTDPNGAKCGATFDPMTQRGVVTLAPDDDANVIYVDIRALGDEYGYAYSLWVYLEYNDHPGLQTNKNIPSEIDADSYDNCTTAAHKSLAPDLLIW